MVTTLILNNSRKAKHFWLQFYTRVPNTLEFSLLFEIVNLIVYCGSNL